MAHSFGFCIDTQLGLEFRHNKVMELFQGNWFIMLRDALRFIPVVFHMDAAVVLRDIWNLSTGLNCGVHGL